jgi:membrane fusion protein (multidrug efflux system)
MPEMNAVPDKPKADMPAEQSMPDAPPRKARNMLRPAAVVLALLAVVVLVNWWFVEGVYIESTDNAYVQSDIAVLGPRIDGIVASVNVADNQVVKQGDVLWTLQPDDRQAQLDQAQASLAETEAAVEVSRRQVSQQQAAIAMADAAIASAQAEQTRAAADAVRSQTLVGAGWTSHQANDLAVAERLKADAAAGSARAQRDEAVQGLAVAQANLAQAQARATTARAQVHIAEVNLAYTTTRAPFDGIVGNKGVRVGQYVAPGQQLLALSPPDLYVVANFKETQLARMKPGQRVVFTPDIDASRVVHGTVDSLAPATGALFSLLPPENATGNFTKVVQRVPAKLVIDRDDAARAAGWLRAGLSVTAEVDTRDGTHRELGILGTALAQLGLN